MKIKLPEFKKFEESVDYLDGAMKEWDCRFGDLYLWIVYDTDNERYGYGIDLGKTYDNKFNDTSYGLFDEETYRLVCADLVEMCKKWLSQYIDMEE